MIDLITNKNAVEFRDAFEDAIKSKVVHALEQEKIAIAQSMFEQSDQIHEITKSTYVNALRKKDDPEETRGDSGTEGKIMNRAKREYGSKFAGQLAGVGKRADRPIQRPDPLASRQKAKVTKSGKANKQSISALKSDIQDRRSMSRTPKPKIPG